MKQQFDKNIGEINMFFCYTVIKKNNIMIF